MSEIPLPPFDVHSVGASGPWYLKLPCLPVRTLLNHWRQRPYCLFLDSASRGITGRYSFLMADPAHWTESQVANVSQWQELRSLVEPFHVEGSSSLPPFCGGAAGLLSYDWCRAIEDIPEAELELFPTPRIAMGIYDLVVAWDHQESVCWLISNGFPETDLQQRAALASQQLSSTYQQLRTILAAQSTSKNLAVNCGGFEEVSNFDLPDVYRRVDDADRTWPFPIWAASTKGEHEEALQRSIAYLRAGDVFQVNIAQQLLVAIEDSALDYFWRLREQNPAPMMAYFDLGRQQVVSASPERLFSVAGLQVETRPIKGTCRRTGDAKVDSQAAERLLASTKNGAENVMIVDLLRNDLSKVCRDDSVNVSALCELEPYQFVQHLTSVVVGDLRPGLSAWDVMPAIFPGGSISGAPKVRALEIINELEPVARGPYCGSIGYIGFPSQDGAAADWNILIRTATVQNGWCQIPVGGGIVLDSEPTAEYQETLTKAYGMLAAVRAPQDCPTLPSVSGEKAK